MTMRAIMIVLGCLALMGVMAGLAIGNDDTDLTGPEKAVILLEQELAVAKENGGEADNPVLIQLQEDLARAKAIAAGPPLEPPDPELVAEILNYKSDTKPSWDVGEHECEYRLGDPDLSPDVTVRCVAVPQRDGNLIAVWLLSQGSSYVKYEIHGGGLESAWYTITEIPNLVDAEIEVADQELRVMVDGETIVFDTEAWRDDLAPSAG